jgi:negative regulator of replication initiation
MTTEGAFDFSAYGHYPSWAVHKTKEVIGETSSDLLRRGIDAANKSKKKKKNAKLADQILRKLLPTQTYDNLREWNRLRKKLRRIERAKRRERNAQ